MHHVLKQFEDQRVGVWEGKDCSKEQLWDCGSAIDQRNTGKFVAEKIVKQAERLSDAEALGDPEISTAQAKYETNLSDIKAVLSQS